MTTSFFKNALLCLFLLLFFTSHAQKNFTGLINPIVSVNIQNETPWSYSFGVSNRDIVYHNENSDFEPLFLEFSHYTSRQIGFNSKVSAGVRYRINRLFEDEQNETRLVEQYAYAKKYERIKIAHRLRLAQRLREKTTFRTRYRFAFEIPLKGNRVDAKELGLVTSLEGVWEFGKEEIPNFGVRYSNYLGYRILANTIFNFGFEYRYRNFTQNPYTQLFLVSALKISL